MVLVGAAVCALLDYIGGALALFALGNALVIGLQWALERRRNAAQRRLVHSVAAVSALLEKTSSTAQRERKQHANSLGLLGRDLRTISSSIAGEESSISLQNEKMLAIYLSALRVNTRELMEALGDKQSILSVQGEKE